MKKIIIFTLFLGFLSMEAVEKDLDPRDQENYELFNSRLLLSIHYKEFEKKVGKRTTLLYMNALNNNHEQDFDNLFNSVKNNRLALSSIFLFAIGPEDHPIIVQNLAQRIEPSYFIQDTSKYCLLHGILKNKLSHSRTLKLLIDSKTPVEIQAPGSLETPLHVATINNQQPEILTLLINAKAEVNALRIPDGATPLGLAMQEGNLANASLLLDVKANPYHFPSNRKLPLVACFSALEKDSIALLCLEKVPYREHDKSTLEGLLTMSALAIGRLMISSSQNDEHIDFISRYQSTIDYLLAKNILDRDKKYSEKYTYLDFQENKHKILSNKEKLTAKTNKKKLIQYSQKKQKLPFPNPQPLSAEEQKQSRQNVEAEARARQERNAAESKRIEQEFAVINEKSKKKKRKTRAKTPAALITPPVAEKKAPSPTQQEDRQVQEKPSKPNFDIAQYFKNQVLPKLLQKFSQKQAVAALEQNPAGRPQTQPVTSVQNLENDNKEQRSEPVVHEENPYQGIQTVEYNGSTYEIDWDHLFNISINPDTQEILGLHYVQDAMLNNKITLPNGDEILIEPIQKPGLFGFYKAKITFTYTYNKQRDTITQNKTFFPKHLSQKAVAEHALHLLPHSKIVEKQGTTTILESAYSNDDTIAYRYVIKKRKGKKPRIVSMYPVWAQNKKPFNWAQQNELTDGDGGSN